MPYVPMIVWKGNTNRVHTFFAGLNIEHSAYQGRILSMFLLGNVCVILSQSCGVFRWRWWRQAANARFATAATMSLFSFRPTPDRLVNVQNYTKCVVFYFGILWSGDRKCLGTEVKVWFWRSSQQGKSLYLCVLQKGNICFARMASFVGHVHSPASDVSA